MKMTKCADLQDVSSNLCQERRHFQEYDAGNAGLGKHSKKAFKMCIKEPKSDQRTMKTKIDHRFG